MSNFCYGRCDCPCHWPKSWAKRTADWLMAPMDWATDQPTVKRRLMAVLLVTPIVPFLILPFGVVLWVDYWMTR